jgi:hypothetical protein
MPLPLRRLLAPLLLALSLPACATVTTGTTATISVVTDPPGAACTLTRGGDVVGIVNPTPGSVTVSKSVRAIDVRCNRSGHSEATAAIGAEFQPMTVGNILIGGLVGIVVDAASGAAGTYPGSVTVVLPRQDGAGPERSATPPRTLEDFAMRASQVRRDYDERIDAARRACSPDAMRDCERTITALERARDAELLLLNQQSRAARTGV